MTIAGARERDTSLFDNEERSYDAVLIVSFGGPEGPDDVMPFLDNVLRGRNVSEARKLEVAAHYEMFGGVSPINAQNRLLMHQLSRELHAAKIDLPVYLGNRNWHPFLHETLRTMRDDGVRRAVACFPSAFSCYSSCRQYRENIALARATVGAKAPIVDRIRTYYNHPLFIEAQVANVERALHSSGFDRDSTHLACTAHSIPVGMASCCDYERQLREAATWVAERAGIVDFEVVFQSRSGPPHVAWLAPDINDHLVALRARDVANVVMLPIGFLSDHMEVKYDLDTEAAATADRIGVNVVRADTVAGTPEFVNMLRELIQERMTANPRRPTYGGSEACPELCPNDCCLPAPPNA